MPNTRRKIGLVLYHGTDIRVDTIIIYRPYLLIPFFNFFYFKILIMVTEQRLLQYAKKTNDILTLMSIRYCPSELVRDYANLKLQLLMKYPEQWTFPHSLN